MPLHDRFDELRRRNEAAELAGGPERIARQHKAGKKTARERVELLVDEIGRASCRERVCNDV